MFGFSRHVDVKDFGRNTVRPLTRTKVTQSISSLLYKLTVGEFATKLSQDNTSTCTIFTCYPPEETFPHGEDTCQIITKIVLTCEHHCELVACKL